MSNGKKVILWLETSGPALHLLSDMLVCLTISPAVMGILILPQQSFEKTRMIGNQQ